MTGLKDKYVICAACRHGYTIMFKKNEEYKTSTCSCGKINTHPRPVERRRKRITDTVLSPRQISYIYIMIQEHSKRHVYKSNPSLEDLELELKRQREKLEMDYFSREERHKTISQIRMLRSSIDMLRGYMQHFQMNQELWFLECEQFNDKNLSFGRDFFVDLV